MLIEKRFIISDCGDSDMYKLSGATKRDEGRSSNERMMGLIQILFPTNKHGNFAHVSWVGSTS